MMGRRIRGCGWGQRRWGAEEVGGGGSGRSLEAATASLFLKSS